MSMKAGGLDDLVRATLAHWRPDIFISDESLSRIAEVSSALPGVATEFFGFECRLGGAPPEADFLFCVTREDGGAAALAAELERNPPSADPVWPRLAAFCRRWMDPADLAASVIQNIWLEFDLAGVECRDAVPVPSLFMGTDSLIAGADPALADVVADALDAVGGAEPPTDRRTALRRALQALPSGGALFQLGVMLSRRDSRVRVCVRGVETLLVEGYLARLGLADGSEKRASLLTSLSAMLSEVRLGLDVGPETIGSRVGIECYAGFGPTGAARWQTFLGWLLRQGLVSQPEADALRAWWGLKHRRLLRTAWPDWTDSHPARPSAGGDGALWRSVNHVKATWEPDGSLAAKAYLASRLIWPTDHEVRSLLQPV